jgi:hypothetical protein
MHELAEMDGGGSEKSKIGGAENTVLLVWREG